MPGKECNVAAFEDTCDVCIRWVTEWSRLTNLMHFGQAWHRQRREPNDEERLWIRDNLTRVPVEITARLGARLRTSDLVALHVGDVLTLGIPAEAPIVLDVGDTPKFKGRLTQHAGRVGVRVDHRIEPGVYEA